MKPPLYIISLVALALTCYFTPAAQTNYPLAFTQKIGPSHGLSSYNANKVIQDKYGFIWIATQDGLNRFDGNQFTVYSKTSKAGHRLLGNVINDALIDSLTNTLWVTTSYGGLNGIDLLTGNVVHALQSNGAATGFRNGWLKCFAVCNGLVWIGTYDGIAVYDPAKRQLVPVQPLPFALKDASDKLNASFVYADGFKHVWVFLPDLGMAVYDAVTKKILNHYTSQELGVHERMSYLQFTGRITRLHDSAFIFVVNNGFRLLQFTRQGTIKSNETLPVNKTIREDYIYACALDKQRRLWFSTGERLFVANIRSDQCIPVKDIAGDKSQTDWLNFISYIFFDAQNNMWLGCGKGIAYAQLQEPAFFPFFESDNKQEKLGHVNYVYTENDTLLYACTTEGFYEVNRITNEMTNPGLQSYTNYVFRTRDRKLIISSGEGLLIYQNKRFLPASAVYPELLPIQTEMLNSSIALGDSLLVLGSETNKGIFVWNTRKRTLQGYEHVTQPFQTAIVNVLYKDKKDMIWILSDHFIGRWDIRNNKVSKFEITDPDLKMPLNIMMDVCEAQGSYWISVYGKGIINIDSNGTILRKYSSAEGLLNTGVYKVFPYKDSLLFITSNNGLFTLQPATGQIAQYLAEDGLNSNHFEENCGFIYKDVFYAGGVEGFSRIVPALVTNNRLAPPIFITKIATEYADRTVDTFNLQLNEFSIDENVLQTTLSFAAFNYSSPKRVRYAYRIVDLNTDWIDIGARNFITFIGLKPGHYEVEVKAANEYGVWGNAKKISLHFLPKWYQTAWFNILVVLGIVALLYSLYRYRIMQIRKQQRIRKEIASDLHDDIGGTLNSVKIFTHLAQKEPDPSNHLNNIEVSLTEATLGLRDMIWVLDDSRDTVFEVMERIKKFAQPICVANSVNLVTFIDNHLHEQLLSKAEKRNYLLMAKEGITNSLKYADCGCIQVRFFQTNKKLSLQVKDDGKGFDTTSVLNGYGLKNLAERARQVGAVCEILSLPGKGTVINITKK